MRKNKPFKYYYYYGSFTLRTLNTLRANDFNACLHCTVDIRRDDATCTIYYRGVRNKILSRFEYKNTVVEKTIPFVKNDAYLREKYKQKTLSVATANTIYIDGVAEKNTVLDLP